MRLADLSLAKRRETVILAARVILGERAGELSTFDLASAIARHLGERKEAVSPIGRILADIAPKIPQARRGGTFRLYGRTMQRWVWSAMAGQAAPGDAWEVTETQAERVARFAREADQRAAAEEG